MSSKKSSGVDRRTFLKGVGAVTLASKSVFAGGTAHPPADSPAAQSPAPRADRIVYRGEHLRALAMPLGGIGTGAIALAGDGGLRQWQIVHNVNHLAHVPHSFFAFWAWPENGPRVARILQSSAWYDQSGFQPPATSNDHVVPPESRQLLQQLPGVKELEFVGEYPLAEIRYLDPALPAEVRLEAYSPFIPLNAKDSALPLIVFEFAVKNSGQNNLECALLATLQNLVGWDGHTPIMGVEHFAYGSNRNSLERSAGLTAIDMSNPRLPDDFPFQGRVALAALAEDVSYLTQWDNPKVLWADFAEDGRLANEEGEEPSAEGRTWNGALATSLRLAPGEEKTATFLMAWHFPNRYVTWGQPGITFKDPHSKFWLGTMYSNWFASALEVVHYARDNFARLRQETRSWRDTLYNSTLPYELLDAAGSQVSIMRTPTCFWNQDGQFHAFEGCCGASTGHCNQSGCCPLNCTHVWNYEQALSRLFPEVERTMRHTDFLVQQAPEGYVLTRTILPPYLPRPFAKPEEDWNMALDGMLGTVLKTYREYQRGAGLAWLKDYWPRVAKLMDYVRTNHDPDAEGVIWNKQFNTYDIAVYGLNAFIGSLYLAALHAAEEMARAAGDADAAKRYRQVYEKGRKTLSTELWNGEYFIQKVDMDKYPKYEYGAGCFSDQLLGQWWAHQLGLGYILPPEQVKTAAGSIAKYNWRENFVGFKQDPRVFASEHDQGLLICSWPKGGRPQVPTLYSDEVWTGIEYEVAALLFYEGLVDDGLKIVRGVHGRYDGRERNPWNNVECGDHYARAMSSWALLEAAAGHHYDAAEGRLAFAPRIAPENFRGLFLTADGWGTFEQQISGNSQKNALTITYGKTRLRELELAFQAGGKPEKASATLRGEPLGVASHFAGNTVRLTSNREVEMKAGDTLRVEVS